MRAWLAFLLLFPLWLSADSVLVEDSLRLFDDWVESQIENQQIPGASIAIFHQDKIIWSKAYGRSTVAPSRPMTLDTLFPVCSITKPLTATAIMRLWQEGKLDLDAPIEKYLPHFRIQGYNLSKPITIKDLLNHTSGLPQDADFPYWNDLEFPSFHAIWQNMASQSLVYPTGSHWKYSNEGYALLGKLVEVVAGKDYETFMQNELFVPLGMKSSTFRPQQEKKKVLAQGFSRKYADQERQLLPFYSVGGLKASLGLWSDVHDLARFGLMFVNSDFGLQVLQTPTRRLMCKPTVVIHPQLAYGLGFAIRKTPNATLIEHPGRLPGYSSYLALDPKTQAGVVICVNSQEWLVPWVNEAVRWAFTALKKSQSESEDNTPTPIQWQKYVGKYSNREGEVYVEIYDKSLVLYQPLFANMLDRLIAQADGTFRIVEGYTFSSTNGDTVSFETAKDGTIAWMKIGNMYLYPTKK